MKKQNQTKQRQKRERKISKEWIEQAREYFCRFLKETNFPHPGRMGRR
ncbi:MAG: hypothetical protein AB1765_03450 [Candidatus Hydrogenedentota bacterium]